MVVPDLKTRDKDGFCKPKKKRAKKEREDQRKKARKNKLDGIDCPDFVKHVSLLEKKHRRSVDIWEALEVFNALKLSSDDVEPHSNCEYIFSPVSCRNLRVARKRLHTHYQMCCEVDVWFEYIYGRIDNPYFFLKDSNIPEPHSQDREREDPPTNETSLEIPEHFVFVIDKITSVVAQIKSLTNDNDHFVSFFEDIVGLLYMVGTGVRWDGIVLYAIQVLKRKIGSSFTSSLESILKQFLGFDSVHSSKPEPQSFESFAYLRNFSSLMRSRLFSQFHRLLTLMVTYGFVNPINISLQGLEVFSVEAGTKLTNATDLFEYVIDMFTYFVESGYKVFCGDYSVFNDIDELNKIDRDIIFLATNIDKIFNGSFEVDTKKTVSEYRDMLMKTYNEVQYMSRVVRDRITKQNVIHKLERLANLVIRFNSFNFMGGMRKAPFALSIYGKSSVGKSSVANILINSILVSNGYEVTDENICTLQPDDKFYSTYRQNTSAVIIDDISNTVAAKATVNPAAMIISLVNNIKYTAPKADTKDKGMFQVEPHVVIATSNDRDLGASEWSREPISVLRRMAYHLTVRVRAKYSKNGRDGGKLNPAAITPEDVQFHATHGYSDFWLIDIAEVHSAATETSNKQCIYEPYEFRDVVLPNGDFALNMRMGDVVRFLNVKASIHYAQQEELVKSSLNAGTRMSFCKACKGFSNDCACTFTEEKPEPHSFIVQKAVDYSINKVSSHVYSTLTNFTQDLCPSPLESFLGDKSSYYVMDYVQRRYFSLLRFIPMSVRETDFYRTFHFYRNRKRMIRHLQYINLGIFSIFCGTGIYNKEPVKDTVISSVLATLGSSAISWRMLYSRTMDELETVPYCEAIDSNKMARALSAILRVGVSLATALAVVKIVRGVYELCRASPHGNLSPCTLSEITARDSEVNCWAKTSTPHEKFPSTATMDSGDLANKLQGNCLHISMELQDHIRTTGCFVLNSTYFMCPMHFFYEENNIKGTRIKGTIVNGTYEPNKILVTLTRSMGNTFKGILDIEDIIRVGNHDLCIFSLCSGGIFNNALPYITDQWTYNGAVIAVGRDNTGTRMDWYGTATSGHEQYSVRGNLIDFRGGRYSTSIETKRGMCASPLIAKIGNPHIIGFHIAGNTDTKKGYYITATRSEIQSSLDQLTRKLGNIIPNSAAVFNLNRYGTKLDYKEEISDLAPVCWQEKEPYIIRGSIGVQSTYFSNMKPTVLSKKFMELTGLSMLYGPPKFRPHHWAWSQTLTHACAPVLNMEQNLLNRAKMDYLKPMFKVFSKYGSVHPSAPLSEKEIINGIPGLRFIDSMNFGSSFGYPISGTKRLHLQGEPGDFTFDNIDLIRDEIARMDEAYLRDERYYPIFKACLKDEAIKIPKEKARVFHAADMALQFNLRKYFLPVMRLFHVHPLISECAVGINPQSDEWDQMHKFVSHNGLADDRIVAGDYSKWDIRLPPDVVLMAFNILIILASKMEGYTPKDLQIMKGLATDVTFFTCHFNGTLIEFVSGVPSGHNLTALLNSICNSLLLRCGFFASGGKGNFRQHCHAMTYGDDFWAGLLRTCNTFDHLVYRDFLSKYGMALTMPIKDAMATPFLSIWECDFLKRRSIKCPYDNCMYGALDLDSINKSLVIKGKTTTSSNEHAYAVLYGAIRELSYHTKESWDEWMPIYRELAHSRKFIIIGMDYTHEQYFKYRNGKIDGIAYQEADNIRDSQYTIDYPLILEALVQCDLNNPGDVSTREGFQHLEFGVDDDQNELNKTNEETRYPATKMQEGDLDPLPEGFPEPHSGVIGNEPTVLDAATTESGILHLSGAKEEKVIEAQLQESEMLSLRQDESRSLSNYLSRPLLIAGLDVSDNFDYYDVEILRVFLESTRIRDKIRNYAYLNGILNVKVTSVGSPQASCALLASLHPWWTRDNSLGPMSGRTSRKLDYCQMSQLPSFIIDIGAETGGHIRMPIIAPTNGLNISETEQIQSAFRFAIQKLTTLKKPAGSANIRPQIQVYAWVEDARLTGTTLNSELPVPQSDEYAIDPDTVGTSATTSLKAGIAAATGTMVGRATELGVEALMSAIGLSQPLRPHGVTPIVPRSATNMSCYNSDQNIDSLASDAKNEVLIDTRHLGYEDYDHMALENIATRWALLGEIPIDVTTAPGLNNETVVIPVSPLASYKRPLGSTNLYTPTPLGVATLPFAKWRGGIEYKFTAIGSSFLKGKLKISHDVNTRLKLGTGDRQTTDVQALNTVIWDVSQYRTLTVQVPWASNLAFKDTGGLRDWFGEIIGTSGLETTFDSTNNGLLIIDKFTRCSDLEYSDFSVMVHMRAMPGMAFGDIRAVLANYTFSGVNFGQDPSVPEPQSDIILPDGLTYSEDGTIVVVTLTAENVAFYNNYLKSLRYEEAPPEPQSDIVKAQADVTTFGSQLSSTQMIVNICGIENNVEDNSTMAELCMGEKFFSVRQVIKRYTENFTRNIVFGNNGGQALHRFRIPDRPLLKGWQGPNSLNLTPTSKPATYARDSFLSFFSVCFLGYRGSHRHKVLLSSNDGTQRTLTTYISRAPQGYQDQREAFGATGVNSAASSILISPDMRAGGTIMQNTITNVAEYSTPFQCRAKFAWSQDRTPYTPKFTYDGGYDIPWHQIAIMTGEITSKWVRMSKFIAAGDDYTLFFFMYAPVMGDDSPLLFTQ